MRDQQEVTWTDAHRDNGHGQSTGAGPKRCPFLGSCSSSRSPMPMPWAGVVLPIAWGTQSGRGNQVGHGMGILEPFPSLPLRS